MCTRPLPVLLVGVSPDVAGELSALLGRGMVAVWPTSAGQLATDIRRWCPAMVIVSGSSAIGVREAAEVRQAVQIPVIEVIGNCSPADIVAAVDSEVPPASPARR